MKIECPHCGVEFTAVHLGHSPTMVMEPPKPGDIGICLDCGGWSYFDDNMQRQKPPPNMQKFIDLFPPCIEMKQRVDEIRKAHLH